MSKHILQSWYGAKFIHLLTTDFKNKTWTEIGVNPDGSLKDGPIELLWNICRKIKLLLKKLNVNSFLPLSALGLMLMKEDLSGSGIKYDDFENQLIKELEQLEMELYEELKNIYEQLGADIFKYSPTYTNLVKSVMETTEPINESNKSFQIKSYKEYIEEKEKV